MKIRFLFLIDNNEKLRKEILQENMRSLCINDVYTQRLPSSKTKATERTETITAIGATITFIGKAMTAPSRVKSTIKP